MRRSLFLPTLLASALLSLSALRSIRARAQEQESLTESLTTPVAAVPEPAAVSAPGTAIDEAQEAPEPVPERVRLADTVRFGLSQIDDRSIALNRQRYEPSQFWPALGTLAGFSIGSGFTAMGTTMLVWSATESRSAIDDPGNGPYRVYGAIFAGVGAVSFLVGTLCAWRIRKNKRIRAERELESLGRRRGELELELRALTSPVP